MSRTLWYVIGGGITFGSAVALVLRNTTSTSTPALALIGLAPLLAIPLLALVVSAWVTRSPLLRLSALALWVVYLATYGSFKTVVGCGPEEAADGIVIYNHNVQYHGADPGRVAETIGASDADVIVLQEVWSGFLEELAAQPSMSPLRYRANEPDEGTTGLAVWSRWPLERAMLDRSIGNPRLTVDVASTHGTFTLIDVHTTAPVDSGRAGRWATELVALGNTDTERPTVLAGDFNATADHAQFRGLLAQGWTDVHSVKGCGFGATWPRRTIPPVSLLRLDHILVTDDFQVLAVEIGGDGGSDHASVIATVRLADEKPA
jgi:endonuclease/exonuclease/phosphatase family metal-dependent hydrolase